MKVLVLVPFYPSNTDPYSGVFIHKQIKAIMNDNSGVDIDVLKVDPYAPKILRIFNKKYKKYDNSIKEYEYDGVKVSIVRVLSLPRNLNISFVCKMLYLLINNMTDIKKYDIIHAHCAVHTGYAAARVCKEKDIKSVITIHGSDIMYYSNLNNKMKKISNYILEYSSCVIAISEKLKEIANDKNPLSNVKVLYTGIDLNTFYLNKLRKAKNKVRFIFIGNLLESKGVFDLLDVFNKIVKDGYNCELTYCGSGKHCEKLKRRCVDLKLKKVSFLGAVENEKLPSILAQSDVLVLPSHNEGLGMVLIEALATGTFVIGSKIGGIPEVIDDEINGYLFEPKNFEDLYSKMLKSINNFHKFDPSMLRMTVEDKFCINKNSKKLVKLYQELINYKVD